MSKDGVLVFDMVPEKAESIGRILRNEAYTVYTSANSIEAIDIVSSHRIRVFIVNAGVFGLSGTCFFDLIKSNNPKVSIITYTDNPTAVDYHTDMDIHGMVLSPESESMLSLKNEINKAFTFAATKKTSQEYLKMYQVFINEFPVVSSRSQFRAYVN